MARISLRRLGERADLSVPRGSPQMGARYDADAFGRFAEGMARFLGTGRFIVGQTVLVVGWIVLNTVGIIKHWDPYPFILLNLAFSTQAAYAAPLILLAQNRQDDRDRANIDRDREVATRTQADTEFLARELAAVRLALADMVTTQDLEDSLSRLAKVIADQPLPDGHGSLTPFDKELPRPAIPALASSRSVTARKASRPKCGVSARPGYGWSPSMKDATPPSLSFLAVRHAYPRGLTFTPASCAEPSTADASRAIASLPFRGPATPAARPGRGVVRPRWCY